MSLVHQIALTLIKGIGPRLAKQLLLHFGNAEAVFAATTDQLVSIEGIGKKIAGYLINTNALQEAGLYLDHIEKNKIKVLFYTDEAYPKRLRNCYDAPLVLYYKGTIDLNHHRIVSVVGTRNATAYGRQLCKQLITVLQQYDVLVLSGLAYGIDVAAHQESVTIELPTIGVLAHGLDRIYPASHKGLAQKMILNGGLLTEFLPGTAPDRENFPKRNRIIAGAADVTVVIEASIKGGALITAELANSYSRDVYAFPGRTTDEFSEGCNFLIKTNRAALINTPQDLIYYLGWDDEKAKRKEIQAVLPFNLSAEERLIVDTLRLQPIGIDELSLLINMMQSKLVVLLLTLEMQGIIVSMPGKMYSLA
jgi:DNA processing protein